MRGDHRVVNNRLVRLTFGAKTQVLMGVFFLVITVTQTAWWLGVQPPTVRVVFIVSMEALFFAAYAVIATGLGYRATERVETAVVENIEQADTVQVGAGESREPASTYAT